jgi:hypothetical protein
MAFGRGRWFVHHMAGFRKRQHFGMGENGLMVAAR